MGIEQKINNLLTSAPILKRSIKRIYQLGMYFISDKKKSEGNIKKISPDEDYEFFFGYYDKSPWNKSQTKILCLKVKSTLEEFAPKQEAEIIVIDSNNNNLYEVIGTTNTWNIQQGAMLQWLGPDYDSKVIYNKFIDGEYCSVIYDINKRSEKIIKSSVYSVSSNGEFALTLDFSRLHRMRPGYGYYNKEDETKEDKLPNEYCIYYIDLKTGDKLGVIKYKDIFNFEKREEMIDAEHKVNHIMINPSNNRFMFLHRWIKGKKKYSRLITCNVDGTDLYNLSDDDMVSHCFWKDDTEIMAFEKKNNFGNGYYLMEDKTQKFEKYWPEIDFDGHPSFSHNGDKIVFDSYPDKFRKSKIYISKSDNKLTNKLKIVAKVFSPLKYDNDFRCDLHPRWSRDDKFIAFDSVFEGKRGLYKVEL